MFINTFVSFTVTFHMLINCEEILTFLCPETIWLLSGRLTVTIFSLLKYQKICHFNLGWCIYVKNNWFHLMRNAFKNFTKSNIIRIICELIICIQHRNLFQWQLKYFNIMCIKYIFMMYFDECIHISSNKKYQHHNTNIRLLW